MNTSFFDNPAGTDGFAFIEYCHTDSMYLDSLFIQMGFKKIAKHKSRALSLYRQENIDFLINDDPVGRNFAKKHNGGGVMGIGFCVHDIQKAQQHLSKNRAPFLPEEKEVAKDRILTLEGIGGSFLYLVEKQALHTHFYQKHFDFLEMPQKLNSFSALSYIDHLTHNVHRGKMDVWSEFYTRLFNFREIRYFDIEGKLTGLKSKAMTSPCGKIRIPINESSDDKSQIEEFLRRYNGEGIQHIALGTNDIYRTVESLKENGVEFQTTPDSYYRKIDQRVSRHGEDIKRMKDLQILIDGAPTKGQGLLLQIFTKDSIGPIFFEIIHRRNNEGFGEGNFQALFEALEEDQIRRGVL